MKFPDRYVNVAVVVIRWDEELCDPAFASGHNAVVSNLSIEIQVSLNTKNVR
jgi:hypothetical protein